MRTRHLLCVGLALQIVTGCTSDPVSAGAEPLDASSSQDAAPDVADSGDSSDAVDAFDASSCVDRVSSLFAERFGFGAQTTGGQGGQFTRITSLTDGSLLAALTDEKARWIYFDPALNGETWLVPEGSVALGPNKTIDGRGVDITWQYGYPNNNLGINSPPVTSPPKDGQLNAQHGNLIMTGIRHVGDLGWPYTYESPYFSNGATDGLEIWSGKNYWIHKNTWSRMSDESLGIYHLKDADPDNITFSHNLFIETKTASLIGANGIQATKAHVTIAFNDYREMVNGRAPGEFRNVFAHVFNNVVNYVNDDGVRVAEGASVYTQFNYLNLGCNPGVSGPRFALGVLDPNPALGETGVLYSDGDIVPTEVATCSFTTNSGYSSPPSEPPFPLPTDAAYRNYTLRTGTGPELDAFVTSHSGANAAATTVYCDP